MPFKLSDKPTFRFRVEVKRPDESTGRWAAFDFVGEFRTRSRPEIEAMIKQGLGSDAELLATEFVGWAGVADADGKPLEVNDVNRTALLAAPGVQNAIVKAWLEASITGPAKN